MSDKVEHGSGGEITVTATPTIEYIVPNPTNGGGNNDFADRLHIWNTGANDVFIQINIETDRYTAGDGMLIPAGENDYIFNLRNPIKKFVHYSASGTTIKFSAN